MRKTVLWLLICTLLGVMLLFVACNQGNTPPNLDESTQESEQSTTHETEQETTTQPHVHAFGDWVVLTPSSCTVQGERGSYCACGEERTDVIDPLGHTEVIDEEVTPDCTNTGLSEGKHCDVCGEVLAVQELVEALGHSFGEWYETIAPTESEQGEKRRDCTNCDTYETEILPELTHSHDRWPTEMLAAVAPTCTETGLTEGTKCSRCGEVLAAQESVPALGHTEVVDKAVAPNCVDDGLSEGKHCDVCGEVLVVQELVEALGHSFGEWYETIAPTESDQGEKRRNCTNCDTYETEILPELTHSHDRWPTETLVAVAPTCTETGLTEGKKCSRCGEVLLAQTIVPALNHTDVIDVAVAPTCTKIGLTEGKHCSVCNEVLVAQQEVAALGHTEVIDAAVASTCTEFGLTEGKHCSVCNEVLVAQQEVEALGHTEVIDAAVAPTCTEFGLTEGKHCSTCEVVIDAQTVIPASHVDEIIMGIPPTKTEDGLTDGVKCSRCDNILVEQSVLHAIGSIDLVYDLNEDGKSYSVVGLLSYTETDIVIPEFHNGLLVTVIESDAFKYGGLTSIIIPESVTQIKNEAFYECLMLQSIELPDSVTSIGDGAFRNCKNLEIVKFGKNLIYIGELAFCNCPKILTISLPENLIKIGAEAFEGCLKLVEVINHSSFSLTQGERENGMVAYYARYIHSGDSKIVMDGDYAFFTDTDGQNYLLAYHGDKTELVLPSNYDSKAYSIYQYALMGLDEITEIELPSNLIAIKEYAFSNCSRLLAISIPDSVKNIGEYAFYSCGRLKTAILPSGLTSISQGLFSNCYGLVSVTIPSGVTEIGVDAFGNCTKLCEVINNSMLDIVKGADTYGSVAYYALVVTRGVSQIQRVNDYLFITDEKGTHNLIGYSGVIKKTMTLPESFNGEKYVIYTGAFEGYNEVECFVFTDGILEIRKSAFANCQSLVSIDLPQSVLYIGPNAFHGCSKLAQIEIRNPDAYIGMYAFYGTSFIYNEDNYENGCAYINNWLIKINRENFAIRDGTTYIAAGAYSPYIFDGTVINLVIPKSVEFIDELAFSRANICAVVFEHGSRLSFIGSNAFSSCHLLTSISLPASVEIIDAYAFAHCENLKVVSFALEAKADIGKGAFIGCLNLTDIMLSNCVRSIAESAFEDCISLENIVIPDSVTSIGFGAFKNCISLSSITLPFAGSERNGAQNYHFGYIFGAQSIIEHKMVHIPTNVTITCDTLIHENAFAFTSVKHITLVNMKIIAAKAFYGANNLESIILPSNLEKICFGAFGECRKLLSVKIPDSVYLIEQSAFAYCTSLTEFTLPNGITELGVGILACCDSLERIIVEEGNHWFYSANNCLIFKGAEGQEILVQGCNGSIIPLGVNIVALSAFSFAGCDKITSVVIPETVVIFDAFAFGECTELTDIYYNGTVEQWKAIYKVENWDASTPEYTVHCSNGNILKLPEEISK